MAEDWGFLKARPLRPQGWGRRSGRLTWPVPRGESCLSTQRGQPASPVRGPGKGQCPGALHPGGGLYAPLRACRPSVPSPGCGRRVPILQVGTVGDGLQLPASWGCSLSLTAPWILPFVCHGAIHRADHMTGRGARASCLLVRLNLRPCGRWAAYLDLTLEPAAAAEALLSTSLPRTTGARSGAHPALSPSSRLLLPCPSLGAPAVPGPAHALSTGLEESDSVTEGCVSDGSFLV